MSWSIPDNTACQTCHCRPATQVWTEGALAMVHGAYAYRCELCCLRDQLKHAQERAADIPTLEDRIKELEKIEIANA